MRVIPVDSFPVRKSYSTIESAIAAAVSHPLQRKAQADSARLSGTTLLDACWTDTDFVILWSNELLLHIFLEREDVHWTVRKDSPAINGSRREQGESSPVVLRWPPPLGDDVRRTDLNQSILFVTDEA